MNKNIKPIPSSYGRSRRYCTEQKQEKQESALDYFKKNAWDKREAFANAEPTITSEEYLANLSVKNKMYGWSPTTYRNEAEKPLKKLMESGLNTVKIITKNGDIEVSISACNRVQAIQTATNKLEYANCTDVIDITDKSEHDMHKRNGYRVYNLYRHSFVANRDLVEMTIMVK